MCTWALASGSACTYADVTLLRLRRFWVNRRPSGDAFVASQASGRVSSMPVSLVLIGAQGLAAYPGSAVPTFRAYMADAYGKPVWMPGMGQESLNVQLQPGAATAQLAGTSTVFSGEDGTAGVATLTINAAPSSTVDLHVLLTPNARGVPGVDTTVGMTACRPGQGPSDNGLGCALCRPGTASSAGAACGSCPAGHFQSTHGTTAQRRRGPDTAAYLTSSASCLCDVYVPRCRSVHSV